MKPPAPKNLICDSCQQPIRETAHGWVEWYAAHRPGIIGKGLRVVHHCSAIAGCQYRLSFFTRGGVDYSLSDRPLADFLTDEGLADLLNFLENGELPVSEVAGVIRRLHANGHP